MHKTESDNKFYFGWAGAAGAAAVALYALLILDAGIIASGGLFLLVIAVVLLAMGTVTRDRATARIKDREILGYSGYGSAVMGGLLVAVGTQSISFELAAVLLILLTAAALGVHGLRRFRS